MEKDKMKVAIYSIHSDYKKLSSDFEKLKNLVTECLQNGYRLPFRPYLCAIE